MMSKALAELFGTFSVVFIGAGSIGLCEKYPQIFPAYTIPVAWGLIIALMIFLVSPVSGAHFNPAVTLAFAAAKRIPISQIYIYWGSQLCGGLIAIGLLEAIKKI